MFTRLCGEDGLANEGSTWLDSSQPLHTIPAWEDVLTLRASWAWTKNGESEG